MKKLLFTLACLLCVLGVSAEQKVAASLPFGSNSWTGNSAYTETLTSLDGAWTIVNFNNNKNGWTDPAIIKCGRKNNESTGEIYTAKALTEAIDKVTLKINAVTVGNLTSTTLYVADNAEFTGATDYPIDVTAAGEYSVAITAPKANQYYKVAFVCTSAEKNGVVAVEGLTFYYTATATGPTNPDTPVTPDVPEPVEGADAISAAALGMSAGADNAFRAYTLNGTTGTTYSVIARNYFATDATKAAVIAMNASNEMSGIVNTTTTGVLRTVSVAWNAETPANAKIDVYGSQSSFGGPTALYNGQRTVIATLRKSDAKEGVTTLTISGDYPYAGLRPEAGKVVVDRIDLTWEEGQQAPVELLPAGLSFSAATATATIGEVFTAPVLSKKTDATVTYTSSNTAVATVDATGAVTLVAEGTTVITAAAAATATYEAGTASYTLTVKAKSQGGDTPNPPAGDEVTDNLVAASFGVPTGEGGQNYTTLTSSTMTSGAVYNANLNPNPTVGNVLQIRWNADDKTKCAGIVSTVSGGVAKQVKVKWNGNTGEKRTLAVYGSHTAYTSYSDLLDEAKAGTMLTELAFANKDSEGYTTYTFADSYEYVGFASTYGAMYIDAIEMTWVGNGGGDTPNPPTPPVSDGDLAKWLEAKPATDTELNATLTAVYQNGKDLWVTQDGAWALVYGELSQTYTNGDQIPAPVAGKYEEYNGMPEFVPVASTFGAPTAGTPVAAEAIEISSLSNADIARYIRLEGVSIAADDTDTNGLNFIASDGNATVIVRNRYSKTVTITPCDDATIYGFVGTFNGTLQIYPVIIESGNEPGPGPVEPTEGTATFDWTNPAGLNPAQSTPGEGADNAVNVTDVVFTEGPVSVTWNMPADLAGKSKDPRLYLYKGKVEMRAYSGTSMTVKSTATITRIEFDVNYDDNINATVNTGTLTAGKPAYWEGSANEVVFDWTATSKCNKIIVTYVDNSGIETIETIDAPVEYYNLQGVRVDNPATGIYIRRQGNTVTKVLVK